MDEPKKWMETFIEDLPSSDIMAANGQSSLSGRTNTSSTTSPMSCVNRETSSQDCARQRFIVWTAVKRNASTRMPREKRLECPLLSCDQRFRDHEVMLRHLAECPLLSSGQYWCYDHGRVERFDDAKCKRCLGHPSKRKKMLSMAKSFFHSLGHKSKKAQGYEHLDDGDMLEPPPKYESLSPAEPVFGAMELQDNQISEIDSNEIFDVPELDSTALNSYTSNAMQWQPTPLQDTAASSFFSEDAQLRNTTTRPSLQLNTTGLQDFLAPSRPAARSRPLQPPRSNKGLTPSSSVRSTASTDTTNSNISCSSNTSSLISPISNWSEAWSIGSGHNTSLTSPVEAVSPNRLLAKNPFVGNTVPYDAYHSFNDSFNDCFELPAEPVPQELPDVMAADPMLMAFNPPVVAEASYATNIVLTEELDAAGSLDDTNTTEPKDDSPDIKSLVASSWDALQEHIVSSMLKIKTISDNQLADQLRNMSMQSVAKIGLETLAALLDGKHPSCAISTVCFVHLMYAFSLVLHEQGIQLRSKDLFLQCLSYSVTIEPASRDCYAHLVHALWRPAELSQSDISAYLATTHRLHSAPLPSKGKQPELNRTLVDGTDSLLLAAQNFLDEVECSLVLGQVPPSPIVQESELYVKHFLDFSSSLPSTGNFPFVATGRYVVTMLIGDFQHSQKVAMELEDIRGRIGTEMITTVRKMELALLQAGRKHMPTEEYFDQFVPAVTKLCDPFYSEHRADMWRRSDYHSRGVILLQSLLPELDRMDSQDISSLPDEHDAELEQFLHSISSDEYSTTVAQAVSPATVLSFENPFGPTTAVCSLDDTVRLPAVSTTSVDGTESRVLDIFGDVEPLKTKASAPMARSEADQDVEPPHQEQDTGGDEDYMAYSVCELCGYRPKGAPKWFKGSMRKHKKLQHSAAPPKIYKCPFPGCTSAYKNRQDNLRQHQIEKQHFVDGEQGATRRPSKRKRLPTEADE